MTNTTQKVCFVIMGFGKKTDYESGRTLDLDATYEAIIKPAAEAARMRCIRADEIQHSGIIDSEMYQMLLHSDLVIADISTGNVNAIYELGVRHALRPNSTIIMKESKGKLYFDLNHISTFQYEHLGADIGSREAKRATEDLTKLILSALASSTPDSPVYTFLPDLRKPVLTSEEYQVLLDKAEEHQDRIAGYILAGNQALKESNHDDAIANFRLAEKILPRDPYVIQKLALATYKSEKPTPLTALINSLMIIEILDPARSNDPETLGLTGAIRKRIWLITKDQSQLDAAIEFYGRGFEIRQDYYNGENLALCLDYRAGIQTNKSEAVYDSMTAKKARESVLQILDDIMISPQFEDRSDKKWIHATYANCSFALNKNDQGELHEKMFLESNPSKWEAQTYQNGKSAIFDMKAIM